MMTPRKKSTISLVIKKRAPFWFGHLFGSVRVGVHTSCKLKIFFKLGYYKEIESRSKKILRHITQYRNGKMFLLLRVN